MPDPVRRFSTVAIAFLAAIGLCSCSSGDRGSAKAGSIGHATPSSPARPSKPSARTAQDFTWYSYFIPAHPGRTCTLTEKPIVMTVAGDRLTTTASDTYTLTALQQLPTGLRYNVRLQTRTATTHSQRSATLTPPLTSDLRVQYLLANNGEVQAPQQEVKQYGEDITFDGFVIYPTVEELKAGKSRNSTITASVTSTDPSLSAQMRAQTNDGSATIRMRLVYRVIGAQSRSITTAHAVYRDVVGVKMSVLSVTPVNAAPGSPTARQLSTALKSFNSGATVWWARGVGLIANEDDSAFGKDVLSLSRCSN